ncbi:MAG: hypothetical protein ABL973_02940 [Micropepsaceae bacterium]
MRFLFTMLILSAALVAPVANAAPPASPAKVILPVLPKVPSAPAVLALLRSTLIAVDQGNKTGNYTVLRDLGTPAFREANTPTKLGLVFSNLVEQGVDLLPVLVVEPQYREPPRLTARRMLYVAGTFNIQPRRVSFELLFDVWHGEWRLFGVSIVPG